MFKKIFSIILILIMAVSLSACKKEPIEEPTDTTEITETPQLPASRVKTYAFFGTDARPNDTSARSDVIMLLRIDPEKEDIKIASVYRDTLLDYNGLRKCNSAYAIDGPKGAVKMLENNLDIEIEGYIAANFNTVADIIDLMGGVDIELTGEEAYFANNYIHEMNRMYKKDIGDVAPGMQHLNGIQAVAYARIRYTEGWDYKRTERQRTILTLLFEKMKTADKTQKSIVLEKAFEEIYTNMNEGVTARIIEDSIKYECSDNEGFPKYKTGKSIEGQGDCVIPNDLVKNVKWLHKFLYDETEYEPTETIKNINEQINSL